MTMPRPLFDWGEFALANIMMAFGANKALKQAEQVFSKPTNTVKPLADLFRKPHRRAA